MGSVVNIKQLSRFKMNRIILIFAFFCSAVLCEEVARKPKLFFVSTSATTSTLQTAFVCYVTSAAPFLSADGRRGEPSPLTGWNLKEQFSRPPSRGNLKENLC